MISDASLYSLAVFLGSAAMLLIVLYHFLEINAKEEGSKSESVVGGERKADAIPAAYVVLVYEVWATRQQGGGSAVPGSVHK
ncbi:hypothetical protein B0A55_12443 [Friedmanniomyces simplex]|uniref:Dolichyl-diphosphooligosaccharide--protein glycosyltransferase subunit 4 n=1 Tax=Friedmanniomyces simplex TaxID=329884 RepID=A0A4U0WCG7_9PEZI|nr:hypothetical protein B0A55_12443 [Friedmanniomyces simplex]